MGSRILALALTFLALTATVPPPAQAAPTHRALLDWTDGTFALGLMGQTSDAWPNGTLAPDHARIPFEVSPCHRKLSPGLTYEPEGAFLDAEQGGNEIQAGFPYRFQLTLIDPDGQRLRSVTLEEPDPSIGGPNIPFYTVREPGEYTILLELLEGAAVDWSLRVRGFAADEEPTCDLWLNEVELNLDGADAGEEWVELYNAGSQAVDVSGWSIRGVGNGTGLGNASYAIPEGTVVPAGGYTVVELAGDEVLDDVDETVQLVHPTGAVLDASPPLDDLGENAFTNQRIPDGGSGWELQPGTPGAANPS